MPRQSSNNNTRNPRRGPSRSANELQEKMLVALQKLVVSNEAETNRMIPSTIDVPRLTLRKDRVFTGSFSYNGGNITSNSTAPNNGAIGIQLSLVPGYTSWTQSFDSYRIARVYVEFIPFGISAAANATLGQITTAIDYDDAAATDMATLLQYDTAMTVESGRYFERRLNPRAAKALYSGTLFNAFGQDQSPWIDSDSPSVPLYGLKYSQSISSTANTGYTVLVTLVVNFRNNN